MKIIQSIAKSARFLYHFPMNAGLRRAVLIGLAGALVWAGPAFAQELKPGEQSFFLKNGDTLTGSIVELNAEKSAFELKDGTIVLLRDLWMVNFVNEQWNFPNERNLIESNEHYLFLKSGDVTSGRVTAFAADKREFELESGDKFPIAAVRRIYFSKNVPRGLR
jgi:hypothetical protein